PVAESLRESRAGREPVARADALALDVAVRPVARFVPADLPERLAQLIREGRRGGLGSSVGKAIVVTRRGQPGQSALNSMTKKGARSARRPGDGLERAQDRPADIRDERQLSHALAWQTERMMRIADRVDAGDASRVSHADIDQIFSDARAIAERIRRTAAR
ncbi:MAG: hypothetical protein ACYC9W_07545, partial [Candidatus Limnocylindria bacterium]